MGWTSAWDAGIRDRVNGGNLIWNINIKEGGGME